jgi:hypothetical protein
MANRLPVAGPFEISMKLTEVLFKKAVLISHKVQRLQSEDQQFNAV